MKVLIFLDDERNLSDISWIIYPEYSKVITVRNLYDFRRAVRDLKIETKEDLFNVEFSFDHDLADFVLNHGTGEYVEFTGYNCAKWLIEIIDYKKIDPNHLFWYTHSKNPIGSKKITDYLQGYIDFYNREN